jgi:hypothetical protein
MVPFSRINPLKQADTYSTTFRTSKFDTQTSSFYRKQIRSDLTEVWNHGNSLSRHSCARTHTHTHHESPKTTQRRRANKSFDRGDAKRHGCSRMVIAPFDCTLLCVMHQLEASRCRTTFARTMETHISQIPMARLTLTRLVAQKERCSLLMDCIQVFHRVFAINCYYRSKQR